PLATSTLPLHAALPICPSSPLWSPTASGPALSRPECSALTCSSSSVFWVYAATPVISSTFSATCTPTYRRTGGRLALIGSPPTLPGGVISPTRSIGTPPTMRACACSTSTGFPAPTRSSLSSGPISPGGCHDEPAHHRPVLRPHRYRAPDQHQHRPCPRCCPRPHQPAGDHRRPAERPPALGHRHHDHGGVRSDRPHGRRT